MIVDVLENLAKNGPEGNGPIEAEVKARVEALCDRFPIYPEL
jgi:glycine hydroxymethyltransferase